MNLDEQYRERCLSLARELHTLLGMPSSRFLKMIDEHGAVTATRMLVHAQYPSDTFTVLWEKKRLDLTVEAVIVVERTWDPLFPETDREAARRRLLDYGWKPEQ